MFLFQEVYAPHLTVEEIIRQIPNCPNNVAQEIMKSNNPQAKFNEIKTAFAEIAHTCGEGAGDAFYALRNDKIAAFFVQNPNLVADAFGEIAKVCGRQSYNAFYALRNNKIDALFVQNPNAFVEIAKACGERAGDAFYALRNDKIAAFFVQNPKLVADAFDEIALACGLWSGNAFAALFENDKIAAFFVQNPKLVADAFGEIAKVSGRFTKEVLYVLGDDKAADVFLQYCNGQMNLDLLLLSLYAAVPSLSIEIGRPLDNLHDRDTERREYLAGLSTVQVFGLLMSPPEYFYTSTNHLLFDRLKADLKKEGKSISQLLGEYGLLGTEQCRNLIFRAVTYDRLFGKQDSLFEKSDIDAILGTLLAPIGSDTFDRQYYFLLANAINSFGKNPEIMKPLKERLEERLKGFEGKILLTNDLRQIRSALEYLVYAMDAGTSLVPAERTWDIKGSHSKAAFNMSDYIVDGKLRIIQVFDKEDTGKDHWPMTRDWFSEKSGFKTVLDNGKEVRLESDNARMTLFMGDNDEENQAFIKSELEKNPNAIITFRGHSFSLMGNFPPEIFGNKNGHVLFIPGSCGSSSSTPKYMAANPNTDLRFFSNTSTGRGQVTNVLVDILIGSTRKKLAEFKSVNGEYALYASPTFENLIKENEAKIVSNGGDIGTIHVWTAGEGLLYYVQNHMKNL